MIRKISLLLLTCTIALSFSHCATRSRTIPGLSQEEVQHLHSQSRQIETLAILGFNDFHGALSPREFKTNDPTPVRYTSGGAAMLAAHIKKHRKKFGKRLVVLDAGDQWQGTLESNLEEGAPVVQFYNLLDIQASAVGNHEFDFGPVGPEGISGDPLGVLKARLSEANYPYLMANVFEKKTGKHPELPNTAPHLLIRAGIMNVGIIGLSTESTPVTTRPKYVKDLRFENLVRITQEQAELLRRRGADIVLAVAHAGMKCRPHLHQKSLYEYAIRGPETAQGSCDSKHEIVQLLEKIPQGTLDGVVAGHTHQINHHWINGTPVIQSGASGAYYHLLYLNIDRKTRQLIPDLTRIEGPISVCEKVFAHQGDCNGKRPAPPQGRGPLVQPRLHGEEIFPDPETETLLEKTFARIRGMKDKVLGHAARPIPHIRTEESPLGNLVADAIRAKTGADFALVNPGGIRTNLEAGPITYENVFRVLPFDNMISVLEVTGQELKQIIRIANSGARGFFGMSGLRLKFIDLPYRARSKDLNRDGKISHWEVDRLVSIRTLTGKRIQSRKKYTLATLDFLVGGGDDMGWIMSRIPSQRITLNAGGPMRDALGEYIEKNSSPENPLNSHGAPLVHPSEPRIQLMKGKYKKKTRRKRR